MNFKKLLLNISLFLVFIIPINTLAYSNFVIPGGENIGIKVNTKYVTIQGFYKVNDKYIGSLAGFKVGDEITKINDITVTSIDDMIKVLDKNLDVGKVKISFIRNNKENTSELELIKDENGVYKTGLYVKDSITGIGTLTYIDPTTNIFGALGHTILNKNTGLRVEIKDGVIFNSKVTGINKSENGKPGEKNSKFNQDDTYGKIESNLEEGIFGEYTKVYDKTDLIEISDIKDVKLGKAIIRTVINDEIKEDFEINILEIDPKSETKNILFEITDSELLNITGGVVAGMSGSPIIQDDKLIGAVTHVVVNDTKKGYGISIKNMLEKGEEKN